MQRQHLVPWLLVAASFLACDSPAGFALVSARPAASADAVTKLARSSNAFGFDLYQRLRQQPGNLMISPASITTALAMTWGGAEGATAAQMRVSRDFIRLPRLVR